MHKLEFSTIRFESINFHHYRFYEGKPGKDSDDSSDEGGSHGGHDSDDEAKNERRSFIKNQFKKRRRGVSYNLLTPFNNVVIIF